MSDVVVTPQDRELHEARVLLAHDGFHPDLRRRETCAECARVNRVAHALATARAEAREAAGTMMFPAARCLVHDVVAPRWCGHFPCCVHDERDAAQALLKECDQWRAIYAAAAEERVRQRAVALSRPQEKALAALHQWLAENGACFGDGPEWETAAVAQRWLQGHASRIDALEEQIRDERDAAQAQLRKWYCEVHVPQDDDMPGCAPCAAVEERKQREATQARCDRVERELEELSERRGETVAMCQQLQVELAQREAQVAALRAWLNAHVDPPGPCAAFNYASCECFDCSLRHLLTDAEAVPAEKHDERVRSEERERCANVADRYGSAAVQWEERARLGAKCIAAAIRALGPRREKK